jgi:hypothetical protein
MKIRAVGAELFHADGQTDGQTDMTKLIVAFRSFPNAPRKTNLMEMIEMKRGEEEVETEEIIGNKLGTEFSKAKLFCLAHIL